MYLVCIFYLILIEPQFNSIRSLLPYIVQYKYNHSLLTFMISTNEYSLILCFYYSNNTKDFCMCLMLLCTIHLCLYSNIYVLKHKISNFTITFVEIGRGLNKNLLICTVYISIRNLYYILLFIYLFIFSSNIMLL